MRKNQKGFTLVELLVVIAILAILATVAVVGYSSFIDSAKESNDKTLVGQMNTALQGFDALQEQPETISDLVKVFNDMGIKLDDFKTNKDKMYFYWVKDSNRVIYTDENGENIYPSNVELTDKDGNPYQWYSLSGEIPFENYTEENGTYSVANGKQFAKLVDDYNNGKLTGSDITITLTADIDLKGATVSFKNVASGTTITLDGGNHTISGHRVDKNSFVRTWDGADKNYGYGLFGKTEGTVTVKDLTISGSIIENTDNSNTAFAHSAVLFGNISNGTVTVSNVNINNAVVRGGGKVGSLIGYLTGSATIEKVNVTNTHLSGASLIAKAVGFVTNAKITFNGTNEFEVTSSINEDAWIKMWGTDNNFLTEQNCKLEDVKVYSDKHISNTFIPYVEKVGEVERQYYCGMITEDLYWTGMQNQGFNQSSSKNIT